ncbi:NAD(P)-dependent dehydrogenase, short-chain alcohol dehydrogenase family [Paenibacillus catalpae]|uniref:Probable oxidoreductase n=1 Tax=Paenibacillus catalpae TaxID=1045775 RepID=A0A1I1UX63_9BACL|nr:oxidoreductase [Paenibacillus catalpae]SFD75397.1 NAD(P)-dependent dehydrogenase, short-chain alcohol dehydrogenase family [Paenibacillus catalpae]
MNTNKYTFTPQEPLHTGFGPRTTAVEALGDVNLEGKVAIVTGGYSGLGLETTRVLAAAGAKVIVPARTPEKAKAALASIPGVELETLDLMDPASIDDFAQRFIRSGRPLNILVNSAGVMASGEAYDSRGYEQQFAVNHLGHFQLTARLWPALKAANGARVVSVSSKGHRLGGIDFDDLFFKNKPYSKWPAYAQAKTANALFAVELDRRGESANVRAYSVHPGSILTDLSRHLSDDELLAMGAVNEQGERGYTSYNDEQKTIPEGAATIVWCAVSPMLIGKGGVYCENVDIARMVKSGEEGQPNKAGVSPWAVDREAAAKLWTVSEQLTGVNFEI